MNGEGAMTQRSYRTCTLPCATNYFIHTQRCIAISQISARIGPVLPIQITRAHNHEGKRDHLRLPHGRRDRSCRLRYRIYQLDLRSRT